jgi:membrane protease YdiL (CAAX protease family)
MSLKRLLFFVLTAMACRHAAAQSSSFNIDHSRQVQRLGHAKDSLYQTILDQYKDFIWANPKDPQARVERCRFIQTAYADDFEDYNPNAEAAEVCARELLNVFPKDPDVLLYAAEFLYGDTAIAYLEKLTLAVEYDTRSWKTNGWKVYQQLAEQYDNTSQHRPALYYSTRAMATNDTLDLSLLQARAYVDLKQTDSAIAVLAAHLDSTDLGWTLNQKGRMLLELGAPGKAIEAFHFAARDTSVTQDLPSLAQAMIDNGLPGEARAYLLKDYTQNQWEPEERMQRLLDYDLSYGSADSAALSYKRFVSDSFLSDPLGVYRLKLLVKAPTARWSFMDAVRMLALVSAIALLFIIPYLWILPVHYLGALRRARGKVFTESGYSWGLRHFWVACSLWLFCDLLSTLIFDYPGLIASFSDSMETKDTEAISLISAKMMLFFCTGCLVLTTGLISLKDLRLLVRHHTTRHIFTGIGLAVLLRVVLLAYQWVWKGLYLFTPDAQTSPAMASVTESIVSVNRFYHPALGLLFVTLIVPFYEEVLFRGVFLSACQRTMRFVVANSIQALVFAAMHLEPKLIPFYFVFGMVAGHYSRKTQSLTVGIAMHVTNNLVAFFMIVAYHTH